MAKKRRPLAIGGAAQVRRETFNGLPIVDATDSFTILLKTKNVNAAKGSQKDAVNCILAKACAEQVGASIVAFFRHTAYLELPDAKGNRRVVRYKLDADAAAIVSAFDRGKSIRGEVTVTLKAPSQSETLDNIREREHKRRELRRKAVLRGEVIEPDEKYRRFHKRPNIAELDVRNGSGLVQNIIKKRIAGS